MNYVDSSSLSKPSSVQPEKKLESVVKTPGTAKKKSALRKILADDLSNAKDKMIYDILIPTVKDGLSGVVHNFIDVLIYGDSRRSKQSYTSYSSLSKPTSSNLTRPSTPKTAAVAEIYDYNEIVYSTRYDAEKVLDSLCCALEKYPSVSVADLYDLSGITDTDFTNNNWGWRVLDRSNTSIRVARGGGFLLCLPQAEALR